jgi:hypothetical protein
MHVGDSCARGYVFLLIARCVLPFERESEALIRATRCGYGDLNYMAYVVVYYQWKRIDVGIYIKTIGIRMKTSHWYFNGNSHFEIFKFDGGKPLVLFVAISGRYLNVHTNSE